MRCLAKDPEERFTDTASLANALADCDAADTLDARACAPLVGGDRNAGRRRWPMAFRRIAFRVTARNRPRWRPCNARVSDVRREGEAPAAAGAPS